MPDVGTIGAEDGAQRLGAARADEPGQAEDLAAADLEAHVARPRCRASGRSTRSATGAGASAARARPASQHARSPDHRAATHLRRSIACRAASRSPTTRPSRSTVTRSASRRISSMPVADVEDRDARGAQAGARARTAASTSGSVSAAVGSSRISTRQARASAAAISTSCRWPTPSAPAGRSGIERRRGRPRRAPTSPARAAAARSTSPNRRGRRPRNRFSATLSVGIRFELLQHDLHARVARPRVATRGAIRLAGQRHRAAVGRDQAAHDLRRASTCRRRWRPSARAPRRRRKSRSTSVSTGTA